MMQIIAVDAMGGDNAPAEIVLGAVNASKDIDYKIALVGKEDVVNEELSKYEYNKDKIIVVNASEVIENCDQPTVAIKKKKDSSMVVGMNMVKKGEAAAFVSAGNTGALLTGATVIVGRIKGVERPALGTMLPTEKGFTLLIDAGANVDAKPSYLVQFATMGSVYVENVSGIKDPKVGLVNIGAEREKGNAVVKETYELLEQQDKINFIGNVEARDITKGQADVVICDAFVGNVILKFMEGFGKTMLSMIKSELKADLVSKIGAVISMKAFKRLKKRFDYDDIGGAPFLGLKALVVKAHGSSDNRAIRGAIIQCAKFIDGDIVNKIAEKLS
ncbi:MAG: phosphate acyltransferase PlsX [Firmicutes bacterium]|nr:phosphate acyltransferase PlsX [Bacillota bacterium]